MKPPRSERSQMPSVGEGKRGESGYLGYLLSQASRAYRNGMDRTLADLGVTFPQFIVLTMVGAYPGCSNADLARGALLTPQTVNAIIGKLERKGLVTRQPHAVHGRIQQLGLSDSGRALLEACKERTRAFDRSLSKGLTPEEQQVIKRWLVRVAADQGSA